GKSREGLLEIVEGAVALEMLAIDVGHNPQVRPQPEERAIAFVGFGDEKRTSPYPRMAAKRREAAANHDRRIQSGAIEHQSEHRGRRRLRVRAPHSRAFPGR